MLNFFITQKFSRNRVFIVPKEVEFAHLDGWWWVEDLYAVFVVISFFYGKVNLGMSQLDVSNSLVDIFGTTLTQTTVSRFEAMNLSVKNMSKLMPLFQYWLNRNSGDAVRQFVPTDDLEEFLNKEEKVLSLIRGRRVCFWPVAIPWTSLEIFSWCHQCFWLIRCSYREQ